MKHAWMNRSCKIYNMHLKSRFSFHEAEFKNTHHHYTSAETSTDMQSDTNSAFGLLYQHSWNAIRPIKDQN